MHAVENKFSLANPAYERFRLEQLAKQGTSRFRCRQFVVAFRQKFPELKAVPGYYASPEGMSLGEHWWLITPEGHVVDPTADQFPCEGTGRYTAYDPTVHLTVKGSCPHCGMGLYSREGQYPCSQGCATDLFNQYRIKHAGPFDEDMELTCDQDIHDKYGISLPNLE